MTPDPYSASGGPPDPQSWNRYVYTRGDPVNRVDVRGTCDQSSDTDYSVTVCDTPPPFLLEFAIAAFYAAQGGSRPPKLEDDKQLDPQWKQLVSTTKYYRELLSRKLDSLKDSHCMQLLASKDYSLDDLKFLGSNITYLNSYMTSGQLTLGDLAIVRQGTEGSDTTVASYVAAETVFDSVAGVITRALTFVGAPVVAVTASGALQGSDDLENTLWHEFWHAGLGLGHADALAEFGVAVPAGEDPDLYFGKWLTNDCNAPQ